MSACGRKQLFREILQGQAGKIVVLDNQNGEVFFSTMENLAPELLRSIAGGPPAARHGGRSGD